MENVELLKVIGDEMFILSFIAQKWSEDALKEKSKKQDANSGKNKKQVVPSVK